MVWFKTPAQDVWQRYCGSLCASGRRQAQWKMQLVSGQIACQGGREVMGGQHLHVAHDQPVGVGSCSQSTLHNMIEQYTNLSCDAVGRSSTQAPMTSTSCQASKYFGHLARGRDQEADSRSRCSYAPLGHEQRSRNH